VPGDVTVAARGGSPPGTGGVGAGAGGAISTGQGPVEPPGGECAAGKGDLDRHSAHCGGCGQACAAQLLAMGPRWPVAVAMDATHVYWTTSGNEGAVMRAPLAGGDPEMIAANQSWPSAIAVDATSVYWASGGTLTKAPLAGGMATRLVPQQLQVDAKAIALDGEHLYVAASGENDRGTVLRVPLAGGAPVTLATDTGGVPTAIALDATNVYWANGSSGEQRKVLKVARDGGEPVVLASGTYSVFALAIDAASAYFTSFDTLAGGVGASAVRKVPLAGGSETMLASGSAQPLALAIDRANVYWTNASTSYTFAASPGTDGTVMAVPRTGGTAVALAPAESDPGGIATNGTRVCWVNNGDSTVRCLGACRDGACE
jgi:hypothetical protein